MFDKLRGMLESFNSSPNAESSIRLEEGGFFAPSSDQFIRWEVVTRITCFKRDLLTTDLVCIEILSSMDGVKRVELNEEMPGFEEFCLEMSRIIPDELKGWRRDVAVPAFAANELVIYEKG